MSENRGKVESLVAQVLDAAQNKATGTLCVHGSQDGETRLKQIFFQKGSIGDLDTGRDDTLLEAALLDTNLLSEKYVKLARKKAQKNDITLGAAILDLGVIPDDAVEVGIRTRLTDEICEVATWQIEEVEFFEHETEERLETFFSELCDFYEVLADPEEAMIELARRLDRWEIVQKHFGLLRDVFYATPASFRYFRQQGQFPDEYALLSTVDGSKDVEEVITESGVNPFTAVLLFRQLQLNGDLELINPVQMFQLGMEFSSNKNFDKAYKLFLRAFERGLDDFDLQLRLAQTLDALGRKSDAVDRYMEFAEKCLGQHRMDDALRCLKKVVTLAPDNLEAQERYLQMLLQEKRFGEAMDQALKLADQRKAKGEARTGLEILLQVREFNPKEIQLQQKIVEFAEACGDHETARSERALLAKTCDERKDVEVALETYQRMFCEGNDSLEIRLKLVELHRAKGNNGKALEHISSILNLPEKMRPRDEATMVSLHEMTRDLKPCDLRSNRWLADYYSKNNHKEKAIATLKSWIEHLEREGDLYEMVHAYKRLLAVDESPESRWGLAQVLEKLKRHEEAQRELRNMANLALRNKQYDQATKALEHVLKTSPLDIETRKVQAEIHEAREETEAAARKHEEIALLSVLCGAMQDAELYCRRLDASRFETPEVVRRLGRLCLDQGDQEKALEQLLKASKLHLQQRNLGLCRSAAEEALRIEPGHSEGLAVLEELKNREEAVEGRAPQAPPATNLGTVAATPAAPSPTPATNLGASPATTAPASASNLGAPATSNLGTPATGPGANSGGIFGPAPTLRTTVSSITARLKKLKTQGHGCTRPASASGGAEGEQDAVDTERHGALPDAGGKRSGGKVVASSKALKSAASRLKALAAAKGAGAGSQDKKVAPGQASNEALEKPGEAAGGETAAGEASASETAASAVATRKMKLGKSASRLAALRQGTPQT